MKPSFHFLPCLRKLFHSFKRHSSFYTSALIASDSSGAPPMKKIRKSTQLTLLNKKRAGRPATVDKGIRHTRRERFHKPSSLHLTIKVRENKADIQSKRILKALHYAIKRARLQRLRVIHYTLEYNHVHIVVEAVDNKILHKGMQAFGISLSKAINKAKQLKGSVYKHRYHFRKINSRREMKHALRYIFRNGVKHKRAMSIIDPYNSLVAEKTITADIYRTINRSVFLSKLKGELEGILDVRKMFYLSVGDLWG